MVRTRLIDKVVISWFLYQFALGMLVAPFIITFPLYINHYLISPSQDPKLIFYLIWALGTVIPTVISPFFGKYLDSHQCHRQLLWCLTLFTATFFQLLYFVYPFHHYLWDYIVIVVVLNCVSACLRILLNSIMRNILPPSHFGKLSHGGFGVAVIGILIGMMFCSIGQGVSYQYHHVTLLFPTLFLLLALGLLLFYRHQSLEVHRAEVVSKRFFIFSFGVGGLYQKYPQVWRLIFSKALIYSGFVGLAIVFPIFLHHKFMFSEKQIMELYFMGVLLFVLSSTFFGWLDDYLGARQVLLIAASFVWCIAIAVVLCESRYWFVFLFSLICVFSCPLFSSPRSLFLKLIPSEILGLALGGSDVICKLLYLIGPCIYFLVYSLTQMSQVALLSTLAPTPLGLLVLLSIRE